jgi:cobalamin-dependent methionine synthase I
VIVGDKIDPDGRKKPATALERRDYDYDRDLARKKVEACSDILDVNVGMNCFEEIAVLPETAKSDSDLPMKRYANGGRGISPWPALQLKE